MSGSADPEVSVIVPAFDAADTIGAALASILDQPVALEVIVVDDGSRDDTATVAAAVDARVRVLRQDNAGPSAARNRGLAVARAELVAFCDADDTLAADHLPRSMALLAAQPHLDLVLGHSLLIDYPPAELARFRIERPDGAVLLHHLAAGLFRARAFRQVGGFDPELRWFEDYDWYLRAREHHLAIGISDHVAFGHHYRRGSLSHGPRPPGATMGAVLARSLARRRRGGSAGDLGAFGQPVGRP